MLVLDGESAVLFLPKRFVYFCLVLEKYPMAVGRLCYVFLRVVDEIIDIKVMEPLHQGEGVLALSP